MTPTMTHAALVAYLTDCFARLPKHDTDEIHEHYGQAAPVFGEVLRMLGHEGYLVTSFDGDDEIGLIAVDPRHRAQRIPDAFTEGSDRFDNLAAVATFFLELPRFLVVRLGEQPAPLPNDNPAIWDLVIADTECRHRGNALLPSVVRDMRGRDVLGAHRYGTRLQAGNGRLSTLDALEESYDMTAYLRIAVEEGVPGAAELYGAHMVNVFAAKRLHLMQMAIKVRRLRDSMNGPKGDAAAGDFAAAAEVAGHPSPEPPAREMVIYCAPGDEPHARALSAHLHAVVFQHRIKLSIAPVTSALELQGPACALVLVTAEMRNWYDIFGASKLRGSVVLPIRLRACDLQGSHMEKLLVLPRHGAPILELRDADAGWADVAKEIRRWLDGVAKGQA